MKFRKKPVVIEAVQFTRSRASRHAALEFTGLAAFWRDNNGGEMVIRTLEGDLIASQGDWIIKGVKGEFYPCKPDIFDATYERV